MEREKKFTKGPWSFAKDKETIYGECIQISSNGCNVALLPVGVLNAKVNANLISASPDLLEALEECICIHFDEDESPCEECDHILCEIQRKIISAIKKAYGEQP